MLIAIIRADSTDPDPERVSYFRLSGPNGPNGNETVIEHVTSTVLRGPFGATILVSAPPHSAKIREKLAGFAVQHVALDPVQAQAGVRQGLLAARTFRVRWEKAASAARSRFGPVDTKGLCSPDIKIRAMVRSFERDGVMFFRGDDPSITAEGQARLVEAFARDAERGAQAAHPFAQLVRGGQAGYPVLLSTPAADEFLALKDPVDFDAWLKQQGPRVLAVAL